MVFTRYFWWIPSKSAFPWKVNNRAENINFMKIQHFCIPGLKSLILRQKWLPVHFWVHRRQPLIFLKDYGWFGRARNALLAEMCLFGPKVHFWSKIRFLTQNALLQELHGKCGFPDFDSKSSKFYRFHKVLWSTFRDAPNVDLLTVFDRNGINPQPALAASPDSPFRWYS